MLNFLNLEKKKSCMEAKFLLEETEDAVKGRGSGEVVLAREDGKGNASRKYAFIISAEEVVC